MIAPTGFQGDLQDVRIDEDEFEVAFESNISVDDQPAEQSLLRRAAEVTLRHGFTHFVVLSRSQQAGVGFSVRPDTIGPSRRTERAIHIRCSAGHPGMEGAIDARSWLRSNGDFSDFESDYGDSSSKPASSL